MGWELGLIRYRLQNYYAIWSINNHLNLFIKKTVYSHSFSPYYSPRSAERWLSGRKHRSWKPARVCSPSRVQIPISPPLYMWKSHWFISGFFASREHEKRRWYRKVSHRYRLKHPSGVYCTRIALPRKLVEFGFPSELGYSLLTKDRHTANFRHLPMSELLKISILRSSPIWNLI